MNRYVRKPTLVNNYPQKKNILWKEFKRKPALKLGLSSKMSLCSQSKGFLSTRRIQINTLICSGLFFTNHWPTMVGGMLYYIILYSHTYMPFLFYKYIYPF